MEDVRVDELELLVDDEEDAEELLEAVREEAIELLVEADEGEEVVCDDVEEEADEVLGAVDEEVEGDGEDRLSGVELLDELEVVEDEVVA